MPLTELLHYFNQEQRRQYGAHIAPEQALRMDRGRVSADYAGLRLGTRFQPLLPLHPDQPYGHEALLTVEGRAGALSPSAAFMLPTTGEEFVYLDRLCRTVHALNFLLQPNSGGLLGLNIHPRHLASVRGDHGLAFERILRQCGLQPEQVMLEIRHDASLDPADLTRAVASYRQHGYRIALDHLAAPARPAIWRAIQPDMVKLAPALGQRPDDRDRVLDQAQRQKVAQRLLIGVTCDDAQALALTHVQADRVAPPTANLSGPTWRRGAFP
ncbi:diguanylate phosphodiesterase [Alcanivorax sp. N3-2A]|nr:diguanylate phosphodiesterase [Alcanivorax sp. N3-2A]|tara:strand:+ start:55135 stop:55944 length:810 start_codon:yes stop_codon:yes gene_type:complete